MTGLAANLLSILMIAAFVLAAGGAYLIASGRNPGKGSLMIVCALVLLGNVLVWTL
ncbi:MAG TPA: hypothetical protein VF702_09885 [Allosphingosinicella sp.]|jgi:hypothetical protein